MVYCGLAYNLGRNHVLTLKTERYGTVLLTPFLSIECHARNEQKKKRFTRDVHLTSFPATYTNKESKQRMPFSRAVGRSLSTMSRLGAPPVRVNTVWKI